MDKQTQPYTFNNVDTEKHRVIITPRGPDPLLFGIRGETPEIVKKAFRYSQTLGTRGEMDDFPDKPRHRHALIEGANIESD